MDLIEHFETFNTMPTPKIKQYHLPEINGIEAGFSGATRFIKKPAIIFTASVENTENAYDDGEILGSFIGMIDIENDKLSDSIQYTLIPALQEPLKIESVTVDGKSSQNHLKVILVTDSDGGKSKALSCELIFQ